MVLDPRTGLDPAGDVDRVGPSGRVTYVAITDDQALAAFGELSRLEGIIPALEPSHAVAWLLDNQATASKGRGISSASAAGVRGSAEGLPVGDYDVLTLSGRGDKDLAEVVERTSNEQRATSPE